MSIAEYLKREVRLKHLKVVIEIEDAIWLTKAAERLNVSQPALSKTLAEIEAAIGKPLFNRSRQGLTPTPVGAAFIHAARGVLAELDKASLDISSIVQSERRTLVIGAMPTASATFLSQAVLHLQQSQPELTIRIVDGPTPALLPQLISGQLHVVVGAHMRQSIPDRVELVPLYEDSMQIAMATRHPLARRRSLAWEECLDYPWILPPAGHTVRSAFDQRLRRLGMKQPRQVVENQSLDFVMEHIQCANAFNLMPGELIKILAAKGAVTPLTFKNSADLRVPLRVMAMVEMSQVSRPDVVSFLRCLQLALPSPAG